MPDGNGKMHIIDSAPTNVEIEPLFNAEVDTAFLLFTRSNPTTAQRITWTSASISASNFNSEHPVRVLIHGFNSGPSSGVNIASTASYLQRGDFNVIV
jgi:pancreatic triacylglycerol lipase